MRRLWSRKGFLEYWINAPTRPAVVMLIGSQQAKTECILDQPKSRPNLGSCRHYFTKISTNFLRKRLFLSLLLWRFLKAYMTTFFY